ncbi:TPA: PTS sugar transporter subunit IIC [Streptococcus suis]|uniref:PTS sugar transporter subunit IIC n=1 Tax=Streptococcus suis TaxID=1307 RepID=UPI000CF4EA93|nr:PTS transporter subunit EIIC [Streptococcus suis]HEL1895385.1 PTS sugar transporter subunit IIC [Streptococcus suis]HEL2334869.1 PTS sugar transporter subunit IIC [Streptococcus suis]HEL2480568.1 PTS sugar transporter subunit IIC [Streptococcus suis]HEM5158349.1 PTS sugar transporter subunit IIC [Streptococcus suis]HEM5364195.1 PTS sugar transporter subunit IIC [Streptococcus suis]
MKNSLDRLQEKLTPIAAKIGNQKFLVALRDSFVGTMPVIMTGSIALLINAFLVDLPDQFGMPQITETFQWLVDINWLVFKGSIPIVSLLFIFCLGVNIAKIYKTDTTSAGLVALASFVISIGNSITKTFTLENLGDVDLASIVEGVAGLEVSGSDLTVTIGGVLSGAQINARGYFTAIFIGFLATVIFCKAMNKQWVIKLPDSVPPGIVKPFMSIIPGFLAMYAVGIFTYVFNLLSQDTFIEWVYKVLQVPLLGLSQSFFAVILIVLLNKLFWFFGLHGGNVLAPVMEGLFGVAMLANLEAYQAGETIPYFWNSGSFGAYVWFDGLALVLAIFIVSKNKHYREVAKLGLGPVLFNIGEPVNYGLPVVLNPIMFIPYLLGPCLMTAVAYLASAWGLVAPVTQNVTWVMPPILYGFFSTAFDWRSIILSVVCLAIGTLTYIPFVKMADKQVEL